MSLYADEGGSGAHLLVLIHGLGATGAVWAPLLHVVEARWRGRWFAPDLPGHGRSARGPRYSVEVGASAVGQAVASRTERGARLLILGHSFGGAIGLALASGRFGVQPNVVCSVGIKLTWSDDDIRRMSALAAQPAKRFANEADAWERYLKVSGLAGLAAPGASVAARGIARDGEAWTLAMDPLANDAGKPSFGDLMSAARCPVHLARGGRDALVTLEETRALDPGATDLGAFGHNVHVEAPGLLWSWFEGHSYA